MAKTPSLNASIRLVRRPAGRSRFGGTSLTGKACPGSFLATHRHTDLRSRTSQRRGNSELHNGNEAGIIRAG